MTTDEQWMQYALTLADQAYQQGEVPVGAIVVQDDKIIAKGWNQPIVKHDPSAHAEMMALRLAGQLKQNYRLPQTSLYVTLEPCLMCAGAMLHARIERVIFGAYDPKTGAAGSVFDVFSDTRHNHRIEVVGGVLAEPCGNRLRRFFKERRKK
ncbi:MAG: tRNA adenosine(34) deaminase TadA [Cocleimonas sp.]|nr:tRNA adenosine(34) deaminase TadA [Cocleimonas sp.]